MALFHNMPMLRGAKQLWKVQAPSRWKFFGRLVVHGCCWTSIWLQRHDLRDNHDCTLCAQEVETLDHPLINVPYQAPSSSKRVR
jgi:hypothetical protein